MKKQKNRTCSGRMSEQMALLKFLKERSGVRQSKLEAYLDIVDKASVQYIPKDLCRQEFTLSNGQFVITGKAKQICPLWPNKICPPYLSYDYPFKSPGDGVNFILPF